MKNYIKYMRMRTLLLLFISILLYLNALGNDHAHDIVNLTTVDSLQSISITKKAEGEYEIIFINRSKAKNGIDSTSIESIKVKNIILKNPIFRIDKRIVDYEDLQTLKNKHIEKMVVLDSIEGYQKYGKRGSSGLILFQLARCKKGYD